MDSDEYDDDIADEDLIIAASQAPALALGQPQSAGFNSRQSQPRVQQTKNPGGGLGSLQINPVQRAGSNISSFVDFANLPSDAFPRSPPSHRRGGAQALPQRAPSTGFQQPPRVGVPAPAMRQTTLFGHTVQRGSASQPSQANANRVFRADLPPEPPTHHELDSEAMATWVYPTNLGPTRDYQFNIVKNGLFNNTLVALPTGLGKTFIAATIMLNFFRWTKMAKIVFVAPTKPLVAQQVDACFNIAGIPRSQTTLLTGEIPPALRVDEWGSKRVFFMTPQTLENDLSSGYADPKSIGLLVVDEAHRATGNYSYVKVVTFLRRFSSSFRILALTATPGSKVESVQEVIDSLGISHVEIRTEESIDIRQYVHQRDEDIVLLDPSDEMNHIKELYSKALKPLVEKLSQQNIYYGRDPMALTTFGILKARKDWFAHAGQHVNQGVKIMMMSIFSILGSLAHGIKLLSFHGIKPFYDSLVEFRDETESKGAKGSKYKRQVIDSPSFREMMDKIASWSKKDGFISHPKLTYLSDTVLNHFMDASDGRGADPSNTRIIVFSEYRDSAEEIVRALNIHQPLIRAAVFVGQADSKRTEGMKQAEQIDRIQKFKKGDFNVLVATSIGEEGLDIGQVDLIICYDASASPIRMLQRMGRTGRKRAGRVVLLLMRGKEEEKYAQSKDAYEKMQRMICDGSRFSFRHDLSARIVPRDIRPEVEMKAVEIPIENTQIQGLPEPKKGRATKKKPPKKFHMPDGVETGFTSVAALLGKKAPAAKAKAKEPRRPPAEQDEVVDVPRLDRVLLSESQVAELNRAYKHLPNSHINTTEDIAQVDLATHPAAQRTMRKTVHLKHGEYTRRCVRMLRTIASASGGPPRPRTGSDTSRWRQLPLPASGPDSDGDVAEAGPARKKRKAAPTSEDDIPEPPPPARAPQPKRAAGPAVKTSRGRSAASAVEVDDDDSEGDAVRLPPPRKRSAAARPKATVGRAKTTKTKTKNPRRTTAAAAAYDESADEGDDCRRTSDLELTDDSDSGGDLEGFVVGDDEAVTSSQAATSSAPARARSTSPTSPASSSAGAAGPRRTRTPYYEPTRFDSTQDSAADDSAPDADVPSLSQIVRESQAAAAGAARAGARPWARARARDEDEDEDEEDSGDQGPGPGRRGGRARDRRPEKKRRVIDDDDDDDD
ncbi:P-loop containing nucleoside triphosphate hydrolase protein [Durotheca rogersii]|uniref:P-loop containing nucleoside triphosphate hydrolase protein n=1 Tax=Durotheca rogersii TaxID=419775 RepID=UPI0022206409|nr:P-loop containing nucleoside triphosphate hydrolase protein [Durotheca rogersii]KAI5867103.1 P-loop containing nucleoside triphosphate hydrolase protein [Durotheca rogersii]